MDPLSPDDGGPEKIPAGSTIVVQVVCSPAEPTETTESTETTEPTDPVEPTELNPPDGSG
jgi:hypothetical protein